jgi:ubiquinone/menaquinone biosynthesis C-methylase UbiE
MANDAAFVGSIPENYDRGFGKILFEPYALDIAARAAALNPSVLIETAAGTGIVTRCLCDALPSGAQLTATDLNPPMLEVAKQKFTAGEPIAFRPADAQDLPFDDNSTDLVVCQFGIMFYPDKPKSFREVHRILKSGGHYLFNVWDAHAFNPFGRIAQAVLERFFETDAPQFYRVPFNSYAIDPIKQMLLDAGFAELKIEVLKRSVEIPDVDAFARTTIYGNPLADPIRERGGDPDAVVAEMRKEFREAFGESPGRLTHQAIVYTALKP